MTDDRITLQDLLERCSDASLPREMIGFAAQQLRDWRAWHSRMVRKRCVEPTLPGAALV